MNNFLEICMVLTHFFISRTIVFSYYLFIPMSSEFTFKKYWSTLNYSYLNTIHTCPNKHEKIDTLHFFYFILTIIPEALILSPEDGWNHLFPKLVAGGCAKYLILNKYNMEVCHCKKCICYEYIFGYVPMLMFVVVKFFWSCSNQNLVILIRSCELASIKVFINN